MKTNLLFLFCICFNILTGFAQIPQTSLVASFPLNGTKNDIEMNRNNEKRIITPAITEKSTLHQGSSTNVFTEITTNFTDVHGRDVQWGDYDNDGILMPWFLIILIRANKSEPMDQ